MSNIHLSAVFAHSRSKNATRLVLLALADRADDGGRCYPGIEDLMLRTGLSKTAVWDATKEAVNIEELSVEKYKGPHHTHLYTVHIPNRSESEPFTLQTVTVRNPDINRSESEPKPSVTQKNPQSSSAVKSASSGFDEFYAAYPKKEARADAERAWKKAKLPPLAELLTALEKQKANWTDRKFIPLPASWINGRRWEDEVTTGTTETAHPVVPQQHPQVDREIDANAFADFLSKEFPHEAGNWTAATAPERVIREFQQHQP